ncbi:MULTISPECIES: hypothetical protein [Lactobacillus]|uniref:Uncharacterized protein n=1 Tax=Lactobacillus xujianguonis TaxID=2495899 RepID=A0A437SUK9_9LACO|nr:MULTISPECIES: hypothetical protein [Lactobacillus]RVU70497.1 hypothetical protein EJK17_07340 [Lactobacillus xujianguonis]RVU76833.1 hypothetical protein EJK20_03365 [Lactobacillus xujianguonis]
MTRKSTGSQDQIISDKNVINFSNLTQYQFDDEIIKGFSDFDNGNTFTSEQVKAELIKCRRN